MTASFVHLHLHTEYSLTDGLGSVSAYFDRCVALGMPAMALTDNTNLYAAVKWYKTALNKGVKPILGADLWVKHDEYAPSRITVLCQNNTGYHNLFALISQGYLEGERQEGIPILERAWLNKKTLEGLIVLSGARLGDIGQCVLSDHMDRAEVWLKNWCALLPDNRFYIEIQRTGRPEETLYNQHALALAQQYQLPIVATQDVCFLTAEEFQAHEIRVAIHDGYTMEDPNRPKRYTEQQYLASPEEMCKRFEDLPQAIANTVEIAKRCNVTMTLDEPHLPRFPVPEGMDEAAFLKQSAHEGLDSRFNTTLKHIDTPENRQQYAERLDIELDVINGMGFPGYFLIVADFIRWAKDHDIPVGPGRGSGAGSLVAYALAITDIDPIPYDLLFERFLNPERVSMPDFDIDFCMDGRDRVIEYVAERYGSDAVSQIITFGSMAAKAVVRDVGRVMGHGYGFVDGIAKLVPFEIGMTLSKALQDEPRLKSLYDRDEEVQALIDMALKLEGTVRNVGKHAGGVVIAPTKLTDFSPIYCEEGSKQLVSQFDKNDVESAGLVKFDFLGLRNLTIIHHAIQIVNAIRKQTDQAPITIESIPLNDKKTFDLLKRCETTAIFQLESRGMKDLIKRLQPDTFEDIIALVALFRPGPLQSGMVDDFIDRKHGRAELAYPHPLTEDILEPTYGIILYQEQVMQIAQVLAGYSLGGADLLRRAMGKKKPEEMAKQRQVFMEGAQQNGIEESTATFIFDLMEKFAGYGFNKSHSAAYALVAYQTAWLKSHYPAEFMAAVLSSDMDNTDKVVNFIDDALRQKLQILPPCVNTSAYIFTVQEGAIRFGLGAIKGVGESAIENIIQARQTAPFKDLFGFCQAVDLRKVNRRVIEALIDAGAFDALHSNRTASHANLDQAIHQAEQLERDLNTGQNDLFGGMSDEHVSDDLRFKEITPENPIEVLHREKAALGIYLSSHPMKYYWPELSKMRIARLSGLRPTEPKKPLKIAGLIAQMRRIKTKNDSFMQVIELDDGQQKAEVLMFDSTERHTQVDLQVGQLLIVHVDVRKNHQQEGLRMSAQQVLDLTSFRAQLAKTLKLVIKQEQANQGALEKIKSLFQQYPGEGLPVVFQYETQLAEAALSSKKVAVTLDDQLLAHLRHLLSEEQVQIEY